MRQLGPQLHRGDRDRASLRNTDGAPTQLGGGPILVYPGVCTLAGLVGADEHRLLRDLRHVPQRREKQL